MDGRQLEKRGKLRDLECQFVNQQKLYTVRFA